MPIVCLLANWKSLGLGVDGRTDVAYIMLMRAIMCMHIV
jgi:hypothetical protein